MTQSSELAEGYHRDPDRMTHHYDIEAVWCTSSDTISLCKVGHVDHLKDTKAMLCDTFPQFPKSHWQCWAPYMRGDKERSGLWLRVHHTADFEWRKWDTWRLWRPWREWMDIDTREQAMEFAKGLKIEETEKELRRREE